MPPPADDLPPSTPSRFAATTSTTDEQMTLTWHRRHPHTVLVRVFGEIDLGTAPRLRRALGDAVRQVAPERTAAPPPDDGPRGRPDVVCDLSGVTFLGAAGLAALVETDHAAQARHAHLRVVAGARRVRRVLALSGLDGDLDVVEQLADLAPSVSRTASERPA